MKTAQRRLFFALWPDDATRQALFHWQTHNLPASVNWQHRADLHLTLHFLGAVQAARLDELRALGARTTGPGFTLVIDEIGHWPQPQVLWAGASSVAAELSAVHARLGEGLRALGFVTETRPFRPHVTLARKVAQPPACGPLLPLTWLVRELALVESRPGGAPHYHPVARWPLTWAG